jgi:biopolymer transport protein ExbD
MAEQNRVFDVWFVATNTVYKGVPYQVVTDWVQQARLVADDMLKPTASANWFKVGSLPLFQPYLPKPEPINEGSPVEEAKALEPVEMEVAWKSQLHDDDDDVDMIPLIDISLVLLIFFMMTATVAAISRIAVPNMANATKIDANTKALHVDIDMVGNSPLYGLAFGTAAPTGVDANLSDETSLMLRVDKALAQITDPPEVRIAAHGELPYQVVERVMKQLDDRRRDGKISDYYIEVNEKPHR